MKKVGLIVVVFMLVFTGFAGAEEAGTELSVFIPESLYLHGEGTVAFTSGLGTSFSFGDFIEIPLGFDYCKLHGLMVEGASSGGSAVAAAKPWFMADSFTPYIKVQFNLPIGPITLSAFGGGAAVWNATLTPLSGFITDDLAPAGQYAGLTSLSYKNNFGFGWLAGGSLGLTVHPVTISLFAEYRDIRAPLDLSAAYLTGPSSGLTVPGALDGSAASLIIRGIACGLAGSFAF